METEEKIVHTFVTIGQKPTEEQIREIEAASKKPITFDEDSPELTPEQYAEIAKIARERKAKTIKPTIAIKINPDTLEIAKSIAKGYTDFLSRLLDNAIKDPQIVAKSL